jgi:hypothetical protein
MSSAETTVPQIDEDVDNAPLASNEVAAPTKEYFLDAPLDTASMTVDEIAALIDARADATTEHDVQAQIAKHTYEIETMKQFMQAAVADGVINDTTDENAEDGTVLLKDRSGKYNPIMDAIKKQEAEKSATAAVPAITYKPSTGLMVLVETPYSSGPEVDPADIRRYTDEAIEDCLRRGEVPIAPQLVRNLYDSVVLSDEALKKARRTTANAMANALVQRCDRIVIYSDFGVSKSSKQRADSIKGTAAENSGVVEHRTLLGWSKEDREKRKLGEQAVAARAVVAANKAVSTEVASSKEKTDVEINDPMPDKSRVNRYTVDDNGNAVLQDLPEGVAGFASDGTAIPVLNEGKDFNPRVPNTTGDMEFRNRLMALEYRSELDRYTPLHKDQLFAVVSHLGPKNCNIKTEDYYLAIWEVCKTPAECAKVADHIRRTNPMGKLFHIGVVDLRKSRWFKTAPPQFSKEATATYSNPLHREQMEAYIREQKRAQVELEQRVMDDDIRSRQHTNTLAKQLEEKGMDPNLAQSPAEVQSEIAKHQEARAQAQARKKAESIKAAQQQRQIEDAKKKTQAQQAKRDERRAQVAELHASQRAIMPPSATAARVAPAESKGGVRRKPNAAERAGYAAAQQKRAPSSSNTSATTTDQTDSLAESNGIKINI